MLESKEHTVQESVDEVTQMVNNALSKNTKFDGDGRGQQEVQRGGKAGLRHQRGVARDPCISPALSVERSDRAVPSNPRRGYRLSASTRTQILDVVELTAASGRWPKGTQATVLELLGSDAALVEIA